jgi:hypothetical protein
VAAVSVKDTGNVPFADSVVLVAAVSTTLPVNTAVADSVVEVATVSVTEVEINKPPA